MKLNSPIILLGTLFGFALSRAGATDFDTIFNMFRLTDLHLFGVMGTAVAVTSAAFWLIKRGRLNAATGDPIRIEPKPMKKGLIAGSVLFGAGWALSGTCPGTALAQIGEGRFMGLFTLAGILGGTFLYHWVQRARTQSPPLRSPSLARPSRSS